MVVPLQTYGRQEAAAVCRASLLGAEAHDDAAGETKVVLAIVDAVGELGEKSFGLYHPHGHVFVQPDVEPAANRH